jgi:predicted transcriptional regulator
MAGEYEETNELINFLSRSDARIAILETLHDDAHRIGELKERMSYPRSTLRQNVTKLEDEGLIEERDRRYRPTPFGHVLINDYLELLDDLDTVYELEEFVRWISRERLAELPLDVLGESSITVPTDVQPNAPQERLVEVLAETSTFRGFSPIVLASHVDAFTPRLLEGDLTVEAVLPQRMVTYLDEQYDEFETALETDALRIHVHDDGLEYGLGVTDDRLLLSSFDENLRQTCLVENESERARETGETLFDRYRGEATEIRS